MLLCLRRLAASILCAWLLGPSVAWAWGDEGHRIVALVAADGLTSAARVQVADLLGPDVRGAMETASTWADEIRAERPETRRWHFVDIEISTDGYDAARDCPAGDCVVAQIRKDERLVADGGLARPVRAQALRFLIHFVGDIHQPLHCADHHDRGGNVVRVMLDGRETNLHAVWDTAVVASLGRDPVAVSAELEARMTPQEKAAWSRGGPADWANESFAVAKHDVYGALGGAGRHEEPIQLPDDYPAHERSLVARQLEKAGVRLAMVLNAALSAPAGAASPADVVASDAAGSGVITPASAASYVGRTVTVRGAVSDIHTTRSGTTFIDMGGRYPENAFSAVIFSEQAAEFPDVASLDGRSIEITGRVQIYRGKPQIILRSAGQLESR